MTVQTFGTSDEAYSLFTTNPEQYDVISASGDASLRLVRGGYVQPVNVDLVPNYADIFEALKNKPYNTVDGVHYGIPHGRGAEPADVAHRRGHAGARQPGPRCSTRTSARTRARSVDLRRPDLHRRRGRLPDGDQPDLKIKNPYALDETQFEAAVDLLKAQKPARRRVLDRLRQADGRPSRAATSSVGTTWQIITNLLQASDRPSRSRSSSPKEGATGWSDTWMINSKTKNLNCAYAFIDYIVSPEVNAQIAEYFGEAPGNSKAVRPDRGHEPLRHLPRRRRRRSGRTSGTGRRRPATASTAART